MKGGKSMGCTHERIKSVNCVIYCAECGEKLPADFIPGKHSPEPVEAVKTPEKGEKTATTKTTRRKKV